MTNFARMLPAAAFALAASAFAAGADDASYQAALKDIEATLGSVPTFFTQMPKAGFAGAWQQLKDLEFSQDTALSPKVKALIELAVVAQIPCEYCIWADTAAARAAGASEEEIREAVAVAATGRYWSTMLNGMQVDLPTFKEEFGALLGVEAAQ
ncbi:MAG TPA: carboxymuconolactone decarboxylase family protein [Bauldia sp.]|nr:carboxymuconolactone decarboxylase family protein [Bauldia sp.]